MSRLTDLIAKAKAKDAQLGKELEREFRALSSRRSFGLNFERHRPENVELPGRPVRKGDKVRILPERGSTKKGDQRLWKVTGLSGKGAERTASLSLLYADKPEGTEAAVDDLIVVAEFKDYIYPGLVSTGKVERGGDKPFHTVINGENFHALEALTFTHRGKVDVIYIDPPYNSRAKDWKYNNDYVDPDDDYKHSKWLAMLERRLKIARELLRPRTGVLVATIDEKEVHRLALLLEQVFPESDIQMITSVISAKGAVRAGKFSRVEEHVFVVTAGGTKLTPWFRNMLDPAKGDGNDTAALEWLGLRRREPSSIRGARPNQFYPIFLQETNGHLHSVGDAINDDIDRESVEVPGGTVAVWPLKPDGTEMLWGLTPEVLRRRWNKGYARVNSWKKAEKRGTVQYLPGGTISQIEEGAIQVTGKKRDGSVIGVVAIDEDTPPPKRVWNLPSHNAETGGTNVISKLIPGRGFPYPKSLYAVEDVLRFFVEKSENAIILDFFCGSGTTAHAVMRINRIYGGHRQSISITNNEVAAAEQAALVDKALRPGDADWEKWGICDYVTKPRVEAAISGQSPDGSEVEGDYKFTDEFPMAEGFEENAEFFTLTYETPVAVSHNRAFERIAPLLWMRAGSEGERIGRLPEDGWAVADTYGLLTDLDKAAPFAAAMEGKADMRIAYIVTDDERRFQAVVRQMPPKVEPIRLYESYLTNFRFAMGR
ncbi:site-specific DNA-methyltransferase [Novosphingopyxis sp.]|uniref:site-specific DNA-methyltransferase n=1 Tax=Novosphingopyxis sp. TaxID=2709690 RepID=UPI003B5CAEDC